MPAAAPWPWPASWTTRPARPVPRRAWSSAPVRDGDLDEAAQLARQSMQIPDIPGTELRGHGYLLAGALAEAGDLAAAEQACAATLAQARDAGDMIFLGDLLRIMADLDLRAGRTGDAAAHLREAARLSLQTGTWLLILNVLDGLRVPVRRDRASRRRGHRMGRLGYVQSATRTRARRRGNAPPRRRPGATPGRRSARTGPARPNSAARR